MLYILAYFFFETLISVNIASQLGGMLTFVEIIFSAVAGFNIISRLNYRMRDAFVMMQEGKIDAKEFNRLGASSAIGAIMLIVPGFMTDIIGVLMQFDYFATNIYRKFIKKDNRAKSTYSKGENDVIDVEIIDDHSDRKY